MRLLQQAMASLRQGGILIYPTDTVYGLGCDINNRKAIDRICQIKGINPEKTSFACICADVSILSDYAVQISTPMYKLMRAALPGPYTFIVRASKNIPRHFQSNRKTVGIRVPAHNVAVELVKLLGNPLLTTSLKDEDELREYSTDPDAIYQNYKNLVEVVIDSGPGGTEPSTILDISEGEDSVTLIRQGRGALEPLNIIVREEV